MPKKKSFNLEKPKRVLHFSGSIVGDVLYDESHVVSFPVDPDLEQGAFVTYAKSPQEVPRKSKSFFFN